MGDKKAAGNIDGSHKDRDSPQPCSKIVTDPNLNHATDNDDSTDRIRNTHQRCVQGCRNIPNHLPSDDAGQQEYGEVRDETAFCVMATPTSVSTAMTSKMYLNHGSVAGGRSPVVGWFGSEVALRQKQKQAEVAR